MSLAFSFTAYRLCLCLFLIFCFHIHTDNASIVLAQPNKKKANQKEEIKSGTIKSWKKNESDKAQTIHCTIHFVSGIQIQLVHTVNCTNRKRPPVTKVSGTPFRSDVIAFHLTTNYHLACVKRKERECVTTPGIAGNSTPIATCISAQNKHRAEKIKQLLFNVYGDAKRLTTAAWNWPSRMIAHTRSTTPIK